MKNVTKMTAIAAATLAMFSGMASADPAETKGGITIKTEDGRFEAKVGGRIHFDGNIVDEDDSAFNNAKPAFSSGGQPAQSGFFFRRIYMTLSGKLYGWKYKIEPDFAPSTDTGGTSIGFQDITLSTDLGPGELIIGQRKPFRAMEDLTSSNDLLMIERPFASASAGLFSAGSSREFQDGLFYKGNGDNYTYGVSFTSLRGTGTATTEGLGESARVTFAPLNSEGSILHLGLSYSAEQPAQTGTTTAAGTPGLIGAGVRYAGRRGPSITLGTSADHVNTIGAEVAGAFGPGFFQAEYMTQKQEKVNTAGNDQTINAYYLQGSFFVTGETKPYKKADGVFGSAKPNGANGAVELTARYDFAENKDFPLTPAAGGVFGAGCTTTGLVGAATKCEVSSITVGANYYANPNVRFMLNYIMGEYDLGALGKDKPKTVAARAQISF